MVESRRASEKWKSRIHSRERGMGGDGMDGEKVYLLNSNNKQDCFSRDGRGKVLRVASNWHWSRNVQDEVRVES